MPQTFNRVDMLERNLSRQIEAIRTSDAKVTLLVPTSTAMVGLLAALLRIGHLSTMSAIYVGLSTLPLIATFALMALAIIPRFRGGPSRSLLFFGGLAARSPEDCRDSLLSLSHEAYLADLADQCHASAAIARTKYRLVRHAYQAFFIALPFWTLAIYLLNQPV
jgi:hypothetical protein